MFEDFISNLLASVDDWGVVLAAVFLVLVLTGGILFWMDERHERRWARRERDDA